MITCASIAVVAVARVCSRSSCANERGQGGLRRGASSTLQSDYKARLCKIPRKRWRKQARFKHDSIDLGLVTRPASNSMTIDSSIDSFSGRRPHPSHYRAPRRTSTTPPWILICPPLLTPPACPMLTIWGWGGGIRYWYPPMSRTALPRDRG